MNSDMANPGAESETTFLAEETRRRAAEILKEMDEEDHKYGPGLRCPKCGGMLVHYRMCGYRCQRGCQ